MPPTISRHLPRSPACRYVAERVSRARSDERIKDEPDIETYVRAPALTLALTLALPLAMAVAVAMAMANGYGAGAGAGSHSLTPIHAASRSWTWG